VRLVVLTSEAADVERGSGTALAVRNLRAALQSSGVATSVVQPRRIWPSQTYARSRFNHAHHDGAFTGIDAALGVNGDGRRAAAAAGVPFVALVKAFFAGAAEHERGLTRRVLQAHARWEAEGARGADEVVVPSRFAMTAVVAHYGVDPRRVNVIPEPFDLDAWRATLPLRARNPHRVLCVAHLYPRKRVEDLVRAWPAVRRAVPDAHLDIAGAGPELHRIARMARGLAGCFVHGHLEPREVQELHARAGAFCLPSAQETFGYAVVEAMATGLPVVVADAGALPEITSGGVCSAVAEGDVGALSAAVVAALDTDVQERAAAVNPQRVAAFAPAAVARRLIDVVTVAQAQRRAGGSESRASTSSR